MQFHVPRRVSFVPFYHPRTVSPYHVVPHRVIYPQYHLQTQPHVRHNTYFVQPPRHNTYVVHPPHHNTYSQHRRSVPVVKKSESAYEKWRKTRPEQDRTFVNLQRKYENRWGGDEFDEKSEDYNEDKPRLPSRWI